MDRDASTIGLVLVTLLLLFVALQPIIPQTSEKFSELGILGPGKMISNYPTTVVAGQPVALYCYVGNHEGAVELYRVLVKVVNNASLVLSNSTAVNAPVMASYSQAVGDNQSWVFPVSLTLETTGMNLRIVFELWAFNSTNSGFTYLGLWNQLFVNVTGK